MDIDTPSTNPRPGCVVDLGITFCIAGGYIGDGKKPHHQLLVYSVEGHVRARDLRPDRLKPASYFVAGKPVERATFMVNPFDYVMNKNFATVVRGRGRMSGGMSSLSVYDYYHAMYDLYF